jgi:hypothetical protein
MKNTYSKTRHTFTHNHDYENESVNAVVYGGLNHPNDINCNIHIVDLGEGNKNGRYMLMISNDGWQSDNLAELEAILFPWMESEGYQYDEEVK